MKYAWSLIRVVVPATVLVVLAAALFSNDETASSPSAAEPTQVMSPAVGDPEQASEDASLNLIPAFDNDRPGVLEPEQTHPPELFTIQVGAFRSEENAVRLFDELDAKHYRIFRGPLQIANGELHAVGIGRFEDRQKAQEFAVELTDMEGLPTLVTRLEPTWISASSESSEDVR